MYWTAALKFPLLLFCHKLCLNTCCLYCSTLISFCEVWLNWRFYIFQVVVCDPIWVHWWVWQTVYLWSKCRCVGIYRSEVYPLMKPVSVWLKVMPLWCVLTFSGDLLLGVHVVIVHRLWLHLCNPSQAWQLASYNIVNPWGLPEWSRCAVQSAGSLGWCIVNWWCCREWWHPDVSFLLHPSLICCLFTCMVYLVTFKTNIICTRVSCCLCCVAISWLTLFFMLLTSLVVAVPVSQLSAFPKKGKMLLLVHLLKDDMPLKIGSLLRSWVVVKMRGLWDV